MAMPGTICTHGRCTQKRRKPLCRSSCLSIRGSLLRVTRQKASRSFPSTRHSVTPRPSEIAVTKRLVAPVTEHASFLNLSQKEWGDSRVRRVRSSPATRTPPRIADQIPLRHPLKRRGSRVGSSEIRSRTKPWRHQRRHNASVSGLGNAFPICECALRQHHLEFSWSFLRASAR
jgi:hypothetical protein